MGNDDLDLLEVLKAELMFLEQGGYGRSVRTPQKATSVFRSSPTCLNFNDSSNPNPCSACCLMQFVPEKYRNETLPCHHIPLNGQGQTVDSLECDATQLNLEEAAAIWLRKTIASVQQRPGGRSPCHDVG